MNRKRKYKITIVVVLMMLIMMKSTVNANDTKTISDSLGIGASSIVYTLKEQESTDYYLGTIYRPDYAASTGTSNDLNADWRQPNGDPTGHGYATNSGIGMNCTGFVWHVLVKAGANPNSVPHLAVKYNGTAGGWTKWIAANNIKTYDFATKEEMLKSGILRKGDLIWSWEGGKGTVSNNHHVGFFWGDTPDEDKYWHSGPDANYESYKNQITEILPKSHGQVSWTVVKTGEAGRLNLEKNSSIAEITSVNGSYCLKGGVYGIYKEEECINLVTQLTTDENGKANAALDPGTYYVKEIAPPSSYALNGEVKCIYIIGGQDTELKVSDIPQNAPVQFWLNKIDIETSLNIPQGMGSLEGAEFVIKYYGIRADKYEAGEDPAEKGETPTREWVYKTDENGFCDMTNEKLKISGDELYLNSQGIPTIPLGTLTIQETKPPKGYLLNDSSVHVRNITSEGILETVETYEVPIEREQIQRGDIEGIKVSDGDMKRMVGVPFRITALDPKTGEFTGESHVIVTDGNGFFSTAASWNPHSNHTNEGQTAEDGVWFGEISALDDTKGALPYNTYEIAEMSCEANAGYELTKPFRVSITRDFHTVNMGTITNDYIPKIDIFTTASFADQSKSKVAEGKVQIIDTVEMKGLVIGDTYRLVGWEMNREEETEFLVDGEKVEGAVEFEATETDMTVEVCMEEFKADNLGEVELVTYEELYNISDSEEEKLVVEHKDIENKYQTVKLISPEKRKQSNNPRTGERSREIVLLGILFSSLILIDSSIKMKKRKK